MQCETRTQYLGPPDRKASRNSFDLSNVGQALRLVAETLVQRWTERVTSPFKGPSQANGWTPKRKRRLARREFGVHDGVPARQHSPNGAVVPPPLSPRRASPGTAQQGGSEAGRSRAPTH